MSTNSVSAQTSVPDWMLTYCRQLSAVRYERKLNGMYLHMLESFLNNEPWKALPPYPWQVARIHGGRKDSSVRKNADKGWVPMNMHIPTDLYERITKAIELINANGYSSTLRRNMSMRTFLYTSVCWWITFVYPYEGPGIIPN
ncbi:MAG: hypothetical protein V4713_12385 [Pseudomonadota bacterium]